MTSENYDLKKLKFSFNMAEANYQLDAIQTKLLHLYTRNDAKFRRAFNTNFTPEFIEYLKDKARLREPVHLSCMGQTRSGKSTSMMSVCILHSALNGRRFTSDYICPNSYSFLEKLKSMPEEDLKNSIFLIDEEKKAVFGYGSMAKKVKLQDVQNIIAINNISTVSLTPDKWSNSEANYGLRTFGRCFTTKTVRLMLYNLSEKGRGGELPMGNIYLPIFTALLSQDEGKELEEAYLAMKNEWVRGEMRGEGDVLAEIKRKSAENFMRDEIYRSLTKKNERLVYITSKLGSEWTKNEVQEIETLTKLIEKGAIQMSD